MNCRLCHSKIQTFMDFGKMPLANAFLRSEEVKNEHFFELAAAFCSACCLVQLVDQPERERMFHADYPFMTGSSRSMVEHFKAVSDTLLKKYLPTSNAFVVEIGSNDGTFLSNFVDKKINHIGVEPSKKLAEMAERSGVRTLTHFFDKQTAQKILNEMGLADAITAANVMCHIPYLDSVLEGIRILLKPGGIFCFEDPYLGDMLCKNSYDQIYDEHVFIFSVTALTRLLERHGLQIFDLEPLEVHGGSMRLFAGIQGMHPVSSTVEKQLQFEREAELERIETYHQFRIRCEESRDALRSLLLKLKKDNKRVMGYAATSKSTTVTNYCKITPDLIPGIFDTTPGKQGRLNPGTHIPIVAHEEFEKQPPDYALLFGWNHREEIISKEQKFTKTGGKWITYIPEVSIF